MGSTLYLGRVAAPVSVAKFWGAQGWDAAGDDVSVKGAIACDSPTEAVVIRNQLLGLANNVDESFIPVRWTADPSVDGYYRVRSVSVPMHGSSLAHGRFDFTVNLTRVASYGSPLIEVLALTSLRTNAVAVTGYNFDTVLPLAGTALHGLNPAALSYAPVTQTGDVEVHTVTGVSAPVGWAAEYHVPPADWYDGAATLYMHTDPTHQSVVGDIATMPIVTGRQVPNSPGGWILSNGIIQVWQDITNDYLTMQAWSGSLWRASGVNNTGVKKFLVMPRAGTSPVNATITWRTMRVLRNCPSEVVIRLAGDFDPSDAPPAGWYLDISLRRGYSFVSVVLSQFVGTGDQVQWEIGAAEASEVVGSAGIKADNADGSGDRFVILTPQAITNFDHTNGRIRVAAPLTPPIYPAMFGLAVGDPALGPLSVSGMQGAYFAAGGERLAAAG